MFPGSAVCYERKYGAGHVRLHPEQRVTRIAVYPDPVRNAPRFAVELRLGVRGISAGATGVAFEVHAVCANDGASTMYCAMEGDAGGARSLRNSSTLLTVGNRGISFENEAGFVTLERESGDDRSFILRPISCR